MPLRLVPLPLVWRGIFLPVSVDLVQTLLQSPDTPVSTAYINICVHVKDPVVLVRVWWIIETLKHPACTVGWAVGLSQLAFPRESNRNPSGIIQL